MKQSLDVYFQTILSYVKGYQDFNVLGHMTFIKRYLHYLNTHWVDVNWGDYGEVVDEIFRELIQTSRGIEVNLSGFRYRIDCTLPNLPLIKRYKELGGEIITVGTDAHSRELVGKDISLGYDLLLEAGFRYVTTFSERKPVFRNL